MSLAERTGLIFDPPDAELDINPASEIIVMWSWTLDEVTYGVSSWGHFTSGRMRMSGQGVAYRPVPERAARTARAHPGYGRQ